MSIDKLSHTSWKCKYHIVFAPKYRRQVIYNQIKKDIGKILRQLCELKKVEIKLNQEISLKIKNNKIIIKQEEPQQPIVEIPKLPVTGM